LHFQELQFTAQNTTLQWLYSENLLSSPCPEPNNYQVEIYMQSEINVEMQDDLTVFRIFTTREKNINISSDLLRNSSDNFFSISAASENFTCSTSAYYYNLHFNG
jgi:hypothetical protein